MAALSACVFLVSCGGARSLYKVRPFVEIPPIPEGAKSAQADGITVRVAPLMDDEESQELFEANLPLSGILPVRIEFINQSNLPLDVKRARIRLSDGEGRQWKLLSAKQAISRILDANQVYLYNPHSRKQFETEFREYEIDLKNPLTTAERRRNGFLFFQTPKKQPVASPRNLTLTIEGLPQLIELHLN